MTQEFAEFMTRLRATVEPPSQTRDLRSLRPQTDAGRIALLKIALDQFLLSPGMEQRVGRDVWEFALSVREDC